MALRPMWQCRPRIDRRTIASWLMRVLAQTIDVLDDRVLFDVALPADHAVRTDPRAGLHHHAFVDEAGPFEDRRPLRRAPRATPTPSAAIVERRRADSGRP